MMGVAARARDRGRPSGAEAMGRGGRAALGACGASARQAAGAGWRGVTELVDVEAASAGAGTAAGVRCGGVASCGSLRKGRCHRVRRRAWLRHRGR